MNASREPPGPRYQGRCPPDYSYQEQFGVPSYSPPEYQQEIDYFDRHPEQRPTTSLKRTNRVRKARARESRYELYSHNTPPKHYQRGELNRNFTFPMQPPSEGPKIKETPRHRVEARVVERPFSWINTEASTPEVTSLHELEDEVVEVPHMDPMAESPPEEDGMPSQQRDQVVRAALYIPHPASAEVGSLANPKSPLAEVAARRAKIA
ncbi:unnamed protein product [Clonostachys byssicola]|uniref:Uncharacterized protein n=1 Tax=Clonostachys byssicola TaxID=160290 RepID=A0A9N9Y2P2_9HYPO|nr:unnamed protein product [Clonostachys byssicola]